MSKILITNDDGIQSDGIIRLAKAAQAFGEVWVVAPDDQRSAASHSVTLHSSISVQSVSFPVPGVHAYSCDGTPADCVRLGVLNLVPGRPDVVFSGINKGYNVAADLQYSATVGAALEAVYQKVPAIAFSEDFESSHEVADQYLPRLIPELMQKPLGEKQIWNVNFPGCPIAECPGIRYDCRVFNGDYYRDRFHAIPGPDGTISFTLEATRNLSAPEGTDLRTVLDNTVSVGVVTNIT